MKRKPMTTTVDNSKIAIIHDWMVGGGAEKVIEQLHILYPGAPIITSVCTPEWRERLDGKVVTGILNTPPLSRLRRWIFPLHILWFWTRNLRNYDVIISSSGNGAAKFIRKKNGAKHVAYCHTPPHFLWEKYDVYMSTPSMRPRWLVRLGMSLLLRPLRFLDFRAAQKVDLFIANSTHIKNNIRKYYGRDSVVIFPPVDVDRFTLKNLGLQKRSGFIVWGRHVPYKRLDIAVEACSRLNLPLTVIGEGPDTPRLKKIAGPTIQFTGRLSDKEVVKLAHQAKYFIFPSEEDFGIAPVEAIASGLYVIAYRGGGAIDYIDSNINGEFFDHQTTDSLEKKLTTLRPDQKINQSSLVKTLSIYSSGEFLQSIIKTVDSITEEDTDE